MEAIISENEVNGIPAKKAFYTADYAEGSQERYLMPRNHTLTYVLDGNKWNISSDLLVRSGNGLAGIIPEVF